MCGQLLKQNAIFFSTFPLKKPLATAIFGNKFSAVKLWRLFVLIERESSPDIM